MQTVRDENIGGNLGSRSLTYIGPKRGMGILDIQAYREYRELLWFLLWRDLKVRYKQTLLGATWAVVQPVSTVMLFTVVFGRFASLPSDGMPYAIHAYCALLPWGLFAGIINRSGTSLVSSSNLISKVYFPRLIIPVASALGALVDFAISFIVLLGMMVLYGVPPGPGMLLIPVFTLIAFALALGVGLGLAALNVRYRDISYLISFMLQLWMYASPIVYSGSMVPAKWRALYQLNPMVGVIQGFRWAILGQSGELGVPLLPSVIITVLALLVSLLYFRAVERSFADVI